MILVTVGTQLPFDRLVALMDTLVPSLGEATFAQIGSSSYCPAAMEWSARVNAAEFDRKFREARLIVAHAGIGTVLMAQRYHKPLILYPRRAALKEHRNDHQMATAAALEGRSGIYIARTPEELTALLSQPLTGPDPMQDQTKRGALCNAVRTFIEES